MDGLILLLALVLGVWMLNLNGRIKMLENRLADALDLLTSGKRPETTAPAAEPDLAETPAAVKPAIAYASRRPATLRSEAKSAPPPIAVDEELPSTVDPVELPQRSASWSFEELVGGKLPIWIGGIALVFAGFFLVRYTIDAGLLGPGTRSVLATIFAFLLIAGSQWGGRLPKIGESFTADPRIAQSLAGAGIATLFGTLYMAAEIYGLIGVPVAFALLIATTLLAFALALRHGPPTALMGLVGGFTAPWVAGLGPDNVPVLLLFLGVFLAGLFGLALWRRWLWLLLLASGGGALWTIGLVVTANDSLPLIGMFVMIAGGAAVLVGDRFAEDDPRLAAVARFAPMGIALLQLAMLLPRLEFSFIGWGFYAALSAAAIGLAWRDDRHLPNIFGALLLCLMPLATGWGSQAGHSMMTLASVGTGLLFGVPGHLRAASSAVSRSYWALLALLAQALPFFTAFSLAKPEFSDFAWGGVAALLIVPAGYIAWQWRSAESYIDRIVRIASAGLAALMGWIALTHWFSNDYLASATFVVTAALAAWAMRTQSKAMQELAVIPLAFGVLALATGSWRFFEALNNSLGGIKLMASTLPEIGEAARMTLLPALLVGLIAALPHFALGRWPRRLAWLAGGAGALGFLWLIAKQVAAIDSPSQFITLGLAERVVMTQLLFLAGWLALRRATDWSSLWAKAGMAATALALFRMFWFDLGVFNPLYVPQSLGPIPVANLGTIHLGLTAFWLWQMARSRVVASAHGQLPKLSEIASLVMMALTALVTVRQLAHGNLISGGGIETGENYLYSAALLILSIIWMTIGIRLGLAVLRLAGLALLTVVTLKVFLIDAAALEGVLRILSFMGLGIALIGIGWAYGKVMRAGSLAAE
ncbi:DUF2339 domain-containing protein [Sphingorhabdus sp.]|uniref:DUF2339 domain-containing protein n=3 Tax=Sphingorhabdus sp. TaxID=1902408 RepID=UPI003BAEDAD8